MACSHSIVIGRDVCLFDIKITALYTSLQRNVQIFLPLYFKWNGILYQEIMRLWFDHVIYTANIQKFQHLSCNEKLFLVNYRFACLYCWISMVNSVYCLKDWSACTIQEYSSYNQILFNGKKIKEIFSNKNKYLTPFHW